MDMALLEKFLFKIFAYLLFQKKLMFNNQNPQTVECWVIQY